MTFQESIVQPGTKYDYLKLLHFFEWRMFDCIHIDQKIFFQVKNFFFKLSSNQSRKLITLMNPKGIN
jgi:hypothetical protein